MFGALPWSPPEQRCMPTFDNKVVIVSGGALGTGRACAMAFAHAAARVTTAHLNADANKNPAETVRSKRP